LVRHPQRPNGGFARAVLTRDVNAAKVKDSPDRALKLWPGRRRPREPEGKSFEGAYGAYCVTSRSCGPTSPPEKEMRKAKAMAEAAKAAPPASCHLGLRWKTRGMWVPLTTRDAHPFRAKYRTGPALLTPRAESNHLLHGAGGSDRVPPDVFRMDDLHFSFGMGPNERSDGKWPFPLTEMGHRSFPGIAPKT